MARVGASRALGALAATLALLAAVPVPAGATEATSAELGTLAERAQTDPAALQQLRGVDRVDSRPYRVADALAGARGEELRRRLEDIAALAPRDGSAAEDPAAARGEADEILSDNRYEGSDLPRPFKGVLDWIGDRLEPVGEWIENAFDDLAGVTPGGDVTLWSVTAALILALLATLGSRTLRDRAEEGAEARASAARPDRETPASLERAADRAEREGDHEAALRLRFRAGLLRLDARHAIAFRPSISTREVSRALGSPEFDQLAALFDGVVYGGREASAEDVERSRRGWEAVLRETPR
ncbi:MAG TPA: DUF4129 domain-containing protein [Thermoleophilaceae bacterium]